MKDHAQVLETVAARAQQSVAHYMIIKRETLATIAGEINRVNQQTGKLPLQIAIGTRNMAGEDTQDYGNGLFQTSDGGAAAHDARIGRVEIQTDSATGVSKYHVPFTADAPRTIMIDNDALGRLTTRQCVAISLHELNHLTQQDERQRAKEKISQTPPKQSSTQDATGDAAFGEMTSSDAMLKEMIYAKKNSGTRDPLRFIRAKNGLWKRFGRRARCDSKFGTAPLQRRV